MVDQRARRHASLEQHVALMQAAQAVHGDRAFRRATSSRRAHFGQTDDYRWQLESVRSAATGPSRESDVAWIPELVRIGSRSPSGATSIIRPCA